MSCFSTVKCKPLIIFRSESSKLFFVDTIIAFMHVASLMLLYLLLPIVIFAFLIVLFNLIADVLYGLLDPRIRYD